MKVKLWAMVSPKGELLPSTIREKRGDCFSALKKLKLEEIDNLGDHVLKRVTVEYDTDEGETNV
jgi:hypothetical protein